MLNGKTGALVNKDPAALALSRASARRTPDGGLAADFAVALPPAAASNPAAVDYIVATGPLKPDGASPGFHPWYESGLLSLPPLAPAAPPAAAPAPPACANAAGTPYDACRELAAGVKIYWNASAATKAPPPGRRLAKAATPPTLSGTLETASDGYASFGFPATPGRMVGAKVLVLRDCAGRPGCPPSGASLIPYSLNGKRGAEVVPDDGALTLVSSSARKGASGGLAADFVVALPPAAASNPGAVDYITAVGPLKPSGDIAIHSSTGDGFLDLTAADRAAGAGGVVGVTNDAGVGERGLRPKLISREAKHRLRAAHGILMAAAWAGLAPLGVATAVALRDERGRWFGVHRGLLAAALGVSLVGLVLGGVAQVAEGTPDEASLVAHIVVGAIGLALAAGQGVAGAMRPALGAKVRPAWSRAHRGGGYLTAALTLANLVLGCVVSGVHVGLTCAAALVPAAIYLLAAASAWSKARGGRGFESLAGGSSRAVSKAGKSAGAGSAASGSGVELAKSGA